MPFLPEWAPNVHPLIVHFPIALLIIALVFDIAGIILRKTGWLRISAGLLYIFGAVATVAAFITGREAGDAATIPPTAHPTLSEHADLALYTVWFFGIYGLLRLFLLWKKPAEKIVVTVIVFLTGLFGMGLLYQTAEHGAELVFRHGVGVIAAEDARQALAVKQAEEETLAQSGLVAFQDGSWKWYPEQGAGIVLKRQFSWLLGTAEELNPEIINDETNGSVLALNLPDSPVFLTAGKSLKSVQADIKLNLDGFEGIFMLVHHAENVQNYDFISLVADSLGENDQMKLGRMENGKATIMDKGSVQLNSWNTLKVVGDGRHFRGYLNDKMITHGHANERPSGLVGLFIQGTGKVLIDNIAVQSLR